MGGFFENLLNGLDCCERECEQIFHIRGQVKIKKSHKNDTCSYKNRIHKNEELNCDCRCECKCE